MSTNKFYQYLTLEKNYSKHTLTAYKADIKAFETYFVETYENTEMHLASYVQIRSWIVSLVDSEITNRSINRKVSSLKSYFKFLLKIGSIEVNPLIGHRVLKTSKKLQIPFSDREVRNVFRNVEGEDDDFSVLRDKLIIELFYATGMRRSELVQLRIDDVDMDQQQVKVLGKRNKERYIPLIPSVIKSYKRYIIERDKILRKGQNDYLFLTKKGVKIYETLVYRVVNSYFSKVSVKVKKSPHILRHAFATQLLSEGADLTAVRDLLGHTSLAATQVYTHQDIARLSDIYKSTHPRNNS